MQFHYMIGTVNWAKVLGDPVPNYGKDGFEWTFDFTPDEDGLVLMKKLKIADKLKNKGDERENFIQFKQKEKQASGKANFPITVVDAKNMPWDPKLDAQGKPTNLIGNMSVCEVKFKINEYPGKPTGVYPQALRVLEHKPYVRQEFAPLSEDSKYFQAESVDEFAGAAFSDAAVGDPLEG
jgi:hypothetical protein